MPTATLCSVISALLCLAVAVQDEQLQRGFLGLGLVNSQDPPGLKVISLYPAGPAEAAGLRPDDIITQHGERALRFENDREASGAFAEVAEGDLVEVVYRRNGTRFRLSMKAIAMPGEIQARSEIFLAETDLKEGFEELRRLIAEDNTLVLTRVEDHVILRRAGSTTGSVAHRGLLAALKTFPQVRAALAATRSGEEVHVKFHQDQPTGAIGASLIHRTAR